MPRTLIHWDFLILCWQSEIKWDIRTGISANIVCRRHETLLNLSCCCAFKKPGRILSKLQGGNIIKTMGLMGHMTKLENKRTAAAISKPSMTSSLSDNTTPPSLNRWRRTFLGSRRASCWEGWELSARLKSFLVIATHGWAAHSLVFKGGVDSRF